MSDFKDRLPAHLHPVASWIQGMAEHMYLPNEFNRAWQDCVFGWCYAQDGETYGSTWQDAFDAAEDECDRMIETDPDGYRYGDSDDV